MDNLSGLRSNNDVSMYRLLLQTIFSLDFSLIEKEKIQQREMCIKITYVYCWNNLVMREKMYHAAERRLMTIEIPLRKTQGIQRRAQEK